MLQKPPRVRVDREISIEKETKNLKKKKKKRKKENGTKKINQKIKPLELNMEQYHPVLSGQHHNHKINLWNSEARDPY